MKPAPRKVSANLSAPIASNPNPNTPPTENVSQDSSIQVCPDWRIRHGPVHENPHCRHMHWSTLRVWNRVDGYSRLSQLPSETTKEVISNVSSECTTTVWSTVTHCCRCSIRTCWSPTRSRLEPTISWCRCVDYLQRHQSQSAVLTGPNPADAEPSPNC